MTIQYASDLHLEFPANREYVMDKPLVPAADVLILAGDIMPIGSENEHVEFLDYLSNHWEQVYWLPGNHEYFGVDIKPYTRFLDHPVRHNITMVNNMVLTFEKVRIILTTLWSKISPMNTWAVEQGVNDFHKIKYDGAPLRAATFNALHAESRRLLEIFYKVDFDGKTVVVTHHVPTLMHYPKQYVGSAINEAFAVEMQDDILEKSPAAWIYGHHHQNVPEFKIGNTRMLSNQLGYAHLGEHRYFDHSRTLTVKSAETNSSSKPSKT